MKRKVMKARIGYDTEVSILLAEYDTLRTEIMQRGNLIVKATGVGAAAMVVLVVQIVNYWNSGGLLYFFLALAVFTVGLTGAHWWQADHMTKKLAKRLRDLEQEINRIAGKELLRWETDAGWGGALFKRKRRH